LKSCVYIITDGDVCKIGVTTNLIHRLKCLQSGYPKPLKVLACCSGSYNLEKKLHEMFNDHHRLGEWFDLTLDITLYASIHHNKELFDYHQRICNDQRKIRDKLYKEKFNLKKCQTIKIHQNLMDGINPNNKEVVKKEKKNKKDNKEVVEMKKELEDLKELCVEYKLMIEQTINGQSDNDIDELFLIQEAVQ